MADLKQLLAQKAELDRQIEQTQREQRQQAIEQVRELIRQYGLTAADLRDSRPAAPAAARKRGGAATGGRAKVPAKFRNAETGESWSGRGLQPRWLKAALAAGRKLDDFRV